MVFVTAIGEFEATVHPDTDRAVVVRAGDPLALEALRREVLPDIEILGDHAIVSREEWWHAIDALQARPHPDAPA